MKANAAKYLAGGSVTIGVIERNMETINVIIGTINGTLYGRGRSGRVFRRTNKHTTEAP